jgi:hypothetical protein
MMYPPEMPATRHPVAIASVAVLIVMCAGLWFERRIWHCTCGSWAIWISDVNGRHCSQHLLDAYSFTHFLHGFVFFAGLWYLRDRWTASQRFLACLALEAAWELFENTPFVIDRYRAATMALGYEGDSIVNSIGDLLSCGLGFGVVQRLPWKLSVALFLLIEAALVVMIRDSLALNIIMLLWPLDVLKQWQMGAGGL